MCCLGTKGYNNSYSLSLSPKLTNLILKLTRCKSYAHQAKTNYGFSILHFYLRVTRGLLFESIKNATNIYPCLWNRE